MFSRSRLVCAVLLSGSGLLSAQAPPRTDFGPVPVNGTSTQTLSISFPGQGPLTLALKFGAQFSAGTPTCDASGSACSLPVTFAPKNPGQQRDAVLVENASGQLLEAYFVDGVGVGPQLAAGNGEVLGALGLSAFASGIAVDPLGNLYLSSGSGLEVVNQANGSVTSLGNGGPYYATSVALDSGGNIYFGDYYGNIQEIDGISGVVNPLAVIGGYSRMVLAIDASGNLFVATEENNTILRIDAASHAVTTIAGSGIPGFSGDNGPASAAQVNNPAGIAVDPQGDIFISDSNNARIRKIDPSGTITTVAGNGTPGFSGDGGPATAAQLNYPAGLRVDAGGNLIFADTNNVRIRRVTSNGLISTIAGSSSTYFAYPQPGTPALSAAFSGPVDVALDAFGHFFVTDYYTVELSGNSPPIDFGLTSVGTGSAPETIQFYNVGNAAALLSTADFAGANPSDFQQNNTCGTSLNPGASCSVEITFTPASAGLGTATFNLGNATQNSLETVPLSGAAAVPSGVQDFGQATLNTAAPPSMTLPVQLPANTVSPAFSLQYGLDFTLGASNCPSATPTSCTVQVNFNPKYVGLRKDALLAKDGDGNVVFARSLHGIGSGPRPGFAPGSMSYLSYLLYGTVVAVDPASNLYVLQNGTPGVTPTTVLKVNTTTEATTVIAGGGASTPENVLATKAELSDPASFVLDSRGDLLFTESRAQFGTPDTVSRIDSATGIITTVAGGAPGYSGDGGPATSAALNASALAIDANDNLYLADTQNNVVRKISATSGIITTIAGTGVAGFSGDGGQAASAQLNLPGALALNSNGDLYILEATNIREISAATGVINTVVGPGATGPLAAPLGYVDAMTVDPGDALILGGYIPISGFNSIERIDAQRSVITTLSSGFSSSVNSLLFDSAGNLYVGSNYGSFELSLYGQPVNFSSVAPGQAGSETLSLYNSGNLPLPVNGFSLLGSNPSNFNQSNTCGASVAEGEVCSVTVGFNPTNPSFSSATIALTGDSSTSGYTNLAGNGTQQIAFSFNDLSYSFPATVVGDASSHDFTLLNPLMYSTTAVSSINITGANALDFTAINSCYGDLTPFGDSLQEPTCTISVVFSPGAPGLRSATLSVFAGGTAQTVPLTGMGISSVIGSVSVISFPAQQVLTASAPQTVTLTNSTLAAAPVSLSLTGANAPDFAAVTDCSASFAPSAACRVYVVFTPSQAGTRTATLTVVTPSNTLSIPLSGSGTFTLSSSQSTPARFEIVNSLTGKVLDLASSPGGNGAAVEQNYLNGSTQQQWTLNPVQGSPGVYEIANAATGEALDVIGESTALGALLQQYRYGGTPNQQWQLVPVDDVHYKIVNVNSGYVLDVPGGTTGNGVQIQQYAYVGTPQQMWVLVPVGAYNITNVLSSKSLDLAAGAATNGTAVQQNTTNGSRRQQWQFVPTGGGYFAIMNRLTGKVLDVTGESTAPGAPVQEYDYVGGENQQWQLEPVTSTLAVGASGTTGSIAFRIVNRLSGDALDDTADSTADGNPVQQYTYFGTQNQQWQVTPVQYYNIVNVLSGAALDVPAGSATDRTVIQQYTPDGFQQQEWQFVIVTSSGGTSQQAIVNNLTGKALEVSGSSTSLGALVDESTYTAASNQLWQTSPTASGSPYYQIQNVNSGKVLDVVARSTANGAQIQQWIYLGTENQQWGLIPVIY